jgi:hypothetical protein
MTIEQRLPKMHPRLVKLEDRVGQPNPSWPLSAAAQTIQLVKTESAMETSSASESDQPSSPPSAEDAKANPPNYLETLEMISGAALTMASIEDQSQRIRANALALTQRVRSDRHEANQQIGVLQEQLKASHMLAERLRQQLEQAEERASVAEEWLKRFHEAVSSAFAARRAAETASDSTPALS